MSKIYQKMRVSNSKPVKGKTAGFTLIELLVGVLIIGILAAIAFPQYQNTVFKSRYVEAITLAESFWQAQQRYKMANGKYAWDLYSLDIEPPANMTPAISSGEKVVALRDLKKGVGIYLSTSSSVNENISPTYVAGLVWNGTKQAYYYKDFNGKRYCVPNTKTTDFCKSITGSSISTGRWGAYDLYECIN